MAATSGRQAKFECSGPGVGAESLSKPRGVVWHDGGEGAIELHAACRQSARFAAWLPAPGRACGGGALVGGFSEAPLREEPPARFA
jgi:hypothetical protein